MPSAVGYQPTLATKGMYCKNELPQPIKVLTDPSHLCAARRLYRIPRPSNSLRPFDQRSTWAQIAHWDLPAKSTLPCPPDTSEVAHWAQWLWGQIMSSIATWPVRHHCYLRMDELSDDERPWLPARRYLNFCLKTLTRNTTGQPGSHKIAAETVRISNRCFGLWKHDHLPEDAFRKSIFDRRCIAKLRKMGF